MTNPAADEFTRLVDIMATLRGPDGCPWDREQTIDSLKPFVLEETYEVLEAIDRHDHGELCEELGDFVFEAVFLAQLESEAGHFGIADSLKLVADKLVRRHPHVFARDAGEPKLDSAGQVRTRWEEIKAVENLEKTSRGGQPKPRTLLSGIAAALPALLRAYHIGTLAASVGFELCEKHRFEHEVAELIAQVRVIVAVDRLEHFVRFFEDERLERVDRLFAVPRAAARSAQRGHDLDEPREFSGGAFGFGHLIILIK